MFPRNIIYYCCTTRTIIRNLTTKVKANVEVNNEVITNIENGSIKPRLHPGIYKPRTVSLPENIIEAIRKALADYPIKQILNDSKTLVSYLRGRHPPFEEKDYLDRKSEVTNHVLGQKADLDSITDEERVDLKLKYKETIELLLKTKLYAWKPIEYDISKSLQYLLGRSASEFAVLHRIFQEISFRDGRFKPRSFFDFGSGIGSGMWAAKLFWHKHIFEYFNVDASVHMNDLALILLKGGTGLADANLKGVFHRQFLPATNTTYDLVLSAYTLLELPSSHIRLETILKLWNKTQHYLVIIEQGTSAGFKVINEARDFILDIKDQNNKGHIFSPCPHDKICPRFMSDTTPCNFEIAYTTIPIGQHSEFSRERYCYIVLKKGERTDHIDPWPRVVRPTLVRSKHAICRMCTARGQLEEVVFTASKHGKLAYRCAKATQWGDLLPMIIKPSNNYQPTED